MQKPVIWTDNIEVTYNLGKSNEFKALKNITTDIVQNEYIILFGPSGCGKSTLLFSMFGILKPSTGKVFVKGDSVYDMTPEEFVHFQRKTMGIMYQQFNLIPSISVMDNVALPLIFAGVSPRKREKRAKLLLERYGIMGVAHKRPGLLSGGQQQRVSVARSLVNDPEILIADEPVGNLDAISSKAVMDTLDEINQVDKKTIVLVTHDAKHLPYAHRVYYMHYGVLKRIVPNPEKEQIRRLTPGETIVTEIEQLARIYPYDTPKMLRVKSVVNYLTQSLSFDQILRLEQVSESVIDGRMSAGIFQRILTEDYSRGGVGIKADTAREMAKKMKGVITESRDVARYRKLKKKTKVGTTNHHLVLKIRDYLVNERGFDISQLQKDRLTGIISNRISGYTRKEDFKAQIALPLEQNGVGLPKRDAHAVTRYLEKLVAQGVHGAYSKSDDGGE